MNNMFLSFRSAMPAVLAALLLMTASTALAQWVNDPHVNTSICTALNSQDLPVIVSDGAGGAIIAWEDFRGGNNCDIFAQRINAAGEILWTDEGEAISMALYNQDSPKIVSDGMGGAIITWQDWRSGSYDIYAQRIDAAGVVQWTTDGVPISTADDDQMFQLESATPKPTIVSDGAGGAIITWRDKRSDPNGDIYAQRINADGQVLWTQDGIPISTSAGDQFSPGIVSDGAGGAIIEWGEEGEGTYAQRIDADGGLQWPANGVLVSTEMGAQDFLNIVTDGAGGAIIVLVRLIPLERYWDWDIYAHRITADGVVQWGPNGIAIATSSNHEYFPTTASDGAGGAIIAWEGAGMYVQRVNAGGIVQWATNGIPLATEGITPNYPAIIDDGEGGAIITWVSGPSQPDIYAQRINAAGEVQWVAGEVLVSTAAGGQRNPTLISNGAGGAIITWDVMRNECYDIYAQAVDMNGALGQDITVFTITASADPLGRITPSGEVSVVSGEGKTFTITPKGGSLIADVLVDGTSVGPVSSFPFTHVTADHTIAAKFAMSEPQAAKVAIEKYLKDPDQMIQNAFTKATERIDKSLEPSLWIDADHLTSKGKQVFDRGKEAVNELMQKILKKYPNPWKASAMTAINHLIAGDKNLATVAINEIPSNGNRNSANEQQMALLEMTRASSDYGGGRYDNAIDDYRKAWEHAQLAMKKSLGKSDVETPPISTKFSVGQNYPNPFNPTTTIEFGIPNDTHVRLEVFNMLGERVATLVDETRMAGYYAEQFNAANLASGLYVYRFQAGEFVATKKLMLVR